MKFANATNLNRKSGFAPVGMTKCEAEGTSTFAVRDGRLDQNIEFLRKLLSRTGVTCGHPGGLLASA